MLTYHALPNYEGLAVGGSYRALRSLYDVVHDINERSGVVYDQEDDLMPLAYELRKAFSGNREIIEPPERRPELGPTFAVNMLWPTLLFQTRLLRVALAAMEHRARDQAAVYSLEAVVEEAIDEVFEDSAGAVRAAWLAIDPTHKEVSEKVDGRGAAYLSWRPAVRRASLPDLLNSLSPMYETTRPAWEAKCKHLHPTRLNRAAPWF